MRCWARQEPFSSFRKDWIRGAWIAGSVKRPRKAMAFNTSKTKHEAMSLAVLSERIAERRRLVADVRLPRNTGTRAYSLDGRAA